MAVALHTCDLIIGSNLTEYASGKLTDHICSQTVRPMGVRRMAAVEAERFLAKDS